MFYALNASLQTVSIPLLLPKEVCTLVMSWSNPERVISRNVANFSNVLVSITKYGAKSSVFRTSRFSGEITCRSNCGRPGRPWMPINYVPPMSDRRCICGRSSGLRYWLGADAQAYQKEVGGSASSCSGKCQKLYAAQSQSVGSRRRRMNLSFVRER